MKRYKVTYNYFESGKKMVLMAMWPRLILKVETL